MTSSPSIVASGQTLPGGQFRPNPWGWATVLFCGASSFFLVCVFIVTYVHAPAMTWSPGAFEEFGGFVMGLLGLCYAVGTIGLAVRLLTEEIRVMDETFSWRTWRGTTSVPWNDILDYYDAVQLGLHIMEASPLAEAVPTPSAYRRTHLGVIVTSRGRCRFSPSWPHAAMLRAHVKERATQARAREWVLLGARPDRDWPRTFAYGTPWGDIIAAVFMFFLIGTGIALTAHPAAAFVQGVQADMGESWADVFRAVIVLAGLVVAGLIVLFARAFAETIRRRTQRIMLTSEGIAYADAERQVTARWSEVRALQIARRGYYGYTVETEQGTFDFNASIRDKAILMTGIANQARAFVPMGWQEAASAPPKGNGRFFSYRTGNNRACLVFATIWSLLSSDFSYQGIKFLKVFPENAAGTIFTVLWFAACATASGLTIWAWWNFIVAGVQTDDEGITQRTPLKTKRIVWSDVRHIETRGAESFTVITMYGAHERIRYSALIADGEQLAAEIQRRTGMNMGLS